jgi:membrane protein required for colicin V production
MPIAILDLVVIGVVVISALLAAVRGATREVLAIVAWVAAAVAAWYFHPVALPFARDYITNDNIALVAAIGAIFLVTLIVVSLITVKISDAILDSRIGAIDRTLGFVFGAFRGFLICAIGWIFLTWLVQGQMPDWTEEARTRPMLEGTSESMIGMFPQDAEDLLRQFRTPPGGDPGEPAIDPTLQQRS